MKSYVLKSFLVFIVGAYLSGCAALHSVSMTSYPTDRRKPVEAKVSKLVFLAFNFNNDFVHDLTPKLQQQCPNGKVTGITSTYETRFYFLAHRMIVKSQGFCLTQ